MKPKKNRSRFTVVTATLVLASFGATACSSSPERVATPAGESVTSDLSTTDTTNSTDGDASPRVVSAAEGAAARSRQTQFGAGATDTKLAADSLAGECGVYEPTQEDIDASNVDTEALIAEFVRFGVTHERTVDDNGYVQVDYDYNDVVAQSVADSYWNARFPVEPIAQEDLDANIADNDIIADELEAAGVSFTRSTDESGWESIEYDYDDPAAQEAVNAAWLIISPPQPPNADELASQTEQNSQITAAFDAAGIDHELVSDELGWAWVEWDYEDAAIADQVDAVFSELYGSFEIDPAVDCVAVEPIAVDVDTVAEPGIAEPAIDEPAVEVLPIDVAGEFTPEQIAQRDAEVAALADGFATATVTAEVLGDSPWQTVIFDIANDASVAVVAGVLASRG